MTHTIPRMSVMVSGARQSLARHIPLLLNEHAIAPEHIDDAMAALSITLTDDEAARQEAHYTPRRGLPGASDPAVLQRAAESATGIKASAA